MAQGSASGLSTLAAAADVRADAKLDIAASQRRELTIAKARLNRDEQKHPIAPSNPGSWVCGFAECRGLLLGEKLDWTAFVTFRGYCQDPFALERQRGFTESNVAEEGVQRGETCVARARAVASLRFEVIEELGEERCVEILEAQLGWRPAKASRGETKQEPEGVPVCCNRVGGRSELSDQPLVKEALE